MLDQIIIEDLELLASIGVTDEERSQPQRLTISLWLTTQRDFSHLRDDLRNAVDYHKVATTVTALALRHPRRLLETLAVEIADEILAHFAVQVIDLHLKKFFLAEAVSTGVRLRRERTHVALRVR